MALDFSSNLSAIQALMSPAFDVMANSRISGKGQPMTLSEAQAKVSANPQAYMPKPMAQQGGYYFSPSMMMEGGEREIPQADYSRYQQLMAQGNNINGSYTKAEIANSQLPQFLKESYLEEPPLTMESASDTAINNMFGVSQTQNNQQLLEQKFAQATTPKQVVNESGDDMYEVVNSIITEKVNAMYKNLRKDLISIAEQIVDNISEAGMIKLGETMKVVDKDGNIFEGKMNYKGNLNEMKKKK